MEAKICLITGATTGIGKATAISLSKKGYKIIIHGRDKVKAEAVKQEIEKDSNVVSPEIIIADLSSLEQVRLFAKEYNSRFSKLDILINNAGLVLSKRQNSADGFELTLAINYFAPFLLTSLLFPKILASGNGRIINLSSEALRIAKPDFSDFLLTNKYSGFQAYCISKLYNLMFTQELAKRITSNHHNVITSAVHPGVVGSNFSKSAGGMVHGIFNIMKPFIRSTDKGAETSIFLASQNEINFAHGKYFKDKKVIQPTNKFITSENNTKLWELTEKYTGTKFL